jgi:hypothetical protein
MQKCGNKGMGTADERALLNVLLRWRIDQLQQCVAISTMAAI